MNIDNIKVGHKYWFSWGTGSFSKLIVNSIVNEVVYGEIDPDLDKNGNRQDCSGGMSVSLNRTECDRHLSREVD